MLRILENNPIPIPSISPELSSGGLMALNRGGPGLVFARGVPENTIISALFWHEQLDKSQLTLSKEMYPTTVQGRSVVGYEDPTFVPKHANPFSPGFDGLLCSQVYPSPTRPGKVDVNMVHVQLDGDRATNLTTILTPQQVAEAGVATVVYMAKEGELLLTEDHFLLYEYNGIHVNEIRASHIGVCRINNQGRCFDHNRFWTAQQDGSAHVSTCGSPIPLGDNRFLLFFNRRRDSELSAGYWERIWGITYMIFEVRKHELAIVEVCPHFLLKPPADTTIPEAGRSGAGQLINFGSCVTPLPNNTVEILSHVRDDQPYRAIIAL